MKANELMLGDFFRVNKDGLCIKKGTVVRVVGIDGEDKLESKGLVCAVRCHPLDREQFDGGIWLSYLEPISITPEILEKLGFKKDTGGEECWACRIGWLTPHHYNKKYIPTSWEVQICARSNSFSGVIKYVHQLQAALRLCKIEKEIEV